MKEGDQRENQENQSELLPFSMSKAPCRPSNGEKNQLVI